LWGLSSKQPRIEPKERAYFRAKRFGVRRLGAAFYRLPSPAASAEALVSAGISVRDELSVLGSV